MQTVLIIEKLEQNDEDETWLYQPGDNVSFYNNAFAATFNSNTLAFHNRSGWGPRRDPLAIVIPITIVYILTFFSGIVGNISTCIVIARNKSMHTATNYYLFSLAISDLLLLVSGLPPEIYSIWSKYPYIFGEAFCILQGFAAETSANATVLTITAFTVERYVAICHPFLSHTLSKLNRAIKFVIVIWFVAMCLAVPQAMAFGVIYEELPDGSLVDDLSMCNVKRFVIPHAFEISTVVFFVAPMSLITVLYVLIGLQLHKSTVRPSRGNSVKMKHRVYKPVVTYANPSTQAVLLLNGEPANEKLQTASATAAQDDEGRKNFAKNAQATKHVVKMLIAVVVAFFICWAPFHAQRLLAIYGKRSSAHMITAFQVLTYVSGVFYYLSTTVNPLLYHIMSHKFREAFKGTYKQCFRRGHRTPGGRCYSTLSGRSSQVNSHSNTDSYSRQSSLRYLDAEMARLHDSRRPLVVSFRRKRPATPRRPKQVTIYDDGGGDMQNALGNLNETDQYYLNDTEPSYKEKKSLAAGMLDSVDGECRFDAEHGLRPTHICPLTASELSCLKLEDIEIFQQQQLRINFRRNCSRNKSRSSSLHYDDLEYDRSLLIKSCTMPEIRNKLLENLQAERTGDESSNVVSWESRVAPYIQTLDIKETEETENFISSYIYSDSIPVPVS